MTTNDCTVRARNFHRLRAPNDLICIIVYIMSIVLVWRFCFLAQYLDFIHIINVILMMETKRKKKL